MCIFSLDSPDSPDSPVIPVISNSPVSPVSPGISNSPCILNSPGISNSSTSTGISNSSNSTGISNSSNSPGISNSSNSPDISNSPSFVRKISGKDMFMNYYNKSPNKLYSCTPSTPRKIVSSGEYYKILSLTQSRESSSTINNVSTLNTIYPLNLSSETHIIFRNIMKSTHENI